MATILEENFVKKHIKGNNVFEFGCAPGVFTQEIAKDYNVTAIDLYDVKLTQGYKFIQGNLLKTDIEDKFDSVICMSSLEHCGIESLNYNPGNKENLASIIYVADKLTSLIDKGGRLIMTVPFGYTNVYYVDKKGKSGARSKIKKPSWGFRTFQLSDVVDLFSNLSLSAFSVYGYTKGDYFKELSWEEINFYEYASYDNKQRGLLCCVLERNTT